MPPLEPNQATSRKVTGAVLLAFMPVRGTAAIALPVLVSTAPNEKFVPMSVKTLVMPYCQIAVVGPVPLRRTLYARMLEKAME